MYTIEQIQALLTSNGECPPCLIDSIFQQAVLAALLEINASIDDIDLSGDIIVADLADITWLPAASILGADIVDSFTLVLDDDHDKKYISVINRTNEIVYVSFDGVNINDVVGPNGGSATYNFGSTKGKYAGGVYIGRGTDHPDQGTVYITSYY